MKKYIIALGVLFLFTASVYSQNLVPLTGNNTITTCSGTIQDHAGASNYSSNATGYTVINSATPGNVVRLTFTQFATESSFDFVRIYEGTGIAGTLLYSGSGTLTGASLPTVTSTTGTMTIRFTSDGSGIAAGFTATISCITPCVPVYASFPFTENFESWTNCDGTSNVPSSNWKSNPVTGNNSWRRNDQGSTAAWGNATSGAYSPLFTTGAFSARFHSYQASSGLQGALDLYINCSTGPAAKKVTFDHINTSGTDVLAVFISTDGGVNFTQVGSNITTSSVWSAKSFSFTSSSATTVIRLRSTSDFGATDIGVDNLTVVADASAPSCISTPTAPANGATGVIPSGTTLSWPAAGGATGYDVYFGTPTAVLVSSNQAGTTYATGALIGSTTYSWSIVPKNTNGDATGCSTWTFTTALPPPANDNCAGATAFPAILTDGSCVTLSNQSTANATASGVTPTGACASTLGTADDDVWFSFVAPGPSVVLSSTFVSGSSDVYWHVFSSACSATMTSILCTDTDAGATLTGLTTGATYYIRLYTWSAAVSTVQNICLRTPPPPPANDNCAAAVGLTVNGITCTTPTSGTTVNATQSQISCAGTADDDVWYSFTATSTTHTVTVTPTTLSDAVLQVFSSSGPCTGLTSLGCTDGTGGSSNETVTYTTLTIGSTYYVRVHSYSSASGNGTFSICVTTPAPPACVASPTSPADGATGVTSGLLTWPAVPGATSYDVFIGIGSLPVTLTANVTTNSYSAILTSNSNYVWRVVPRNTAGAAIGCATWSFATGLFYCTPSSTNSTYFIANFNTTGGISNITNTSSGYSTNGYGNFLAQSVSQYNQNPPGNTVNFSVTGGGTFNTYGFGIWVDWDNNGTFATSERVYNSAAYLSSATGSFTVPANQAAGSYRMRVMADYYATSPNPCAFSTTGPNGEVEDYTFIVVPTPAPSCLVSPTSPIDGALGVAVSGTTLTWPAAPFATGYDVYFDEGSSATTLVSSDQPGTSYLIPGTLNSTTLHSWSIVPRNASGNASGCATWSFTTANTPPAQDLCGGAKIISSNAGSSGPTLTGTFTNINCTNTDDPANTCQPASDRGLWWKFTPNATASYSFSTCASVTATTVPDDVLAIFTSSDGTCSGTFTQVACNDNAGSACTNSTQSVISNQTLTAGVTYYILAYANGAANTGNIQIEVTRLNLPPVLTAASGVTVDNQFDITFPADASWEGSITSITVGGVPLDPSAYIINSGSITLKPSESILLQTSGSPLIVVIANDYSNTSVTQLINPGLPANLSVTVQPTAPTVSGGTLGTQPRITVTDQYGNLVLAGVTINAQVNPTQTSDWSLSGAASVATNASGVAIFTNLTATNLTTGIFTGANIIFTPNIGSGNAQSNPFDLPIPPPAYDICSGAVEILCDGSVTIDNTLTTIDALPSSSCGSTSSTVGTHHGFWTKVTPTTSGALTISTCNTTLSPDTYIRIYSGSCGSLTCVSNSSNVGYSDDNCGFFDVTSSATFTATANTTYYILTGLYSSSESTGDITVSVTCPQPPPANDDCGGAIALTVNATANCDVSTSGTTIGATQSQSGCVGTADDDVWYSFIATSASHIVTVTPETLYDAVLQVFNGSCSGLSSITCTDATASASEVATLTGLTVGETYYVRVYTYESDLDYPEDRGTFSICVTTPPPTITVTPTTLTVSGYIESQGPLTISTNTFAVSGSNLIGDINLSAPGNYEISTSASGPFGTSLTFTPTNGVVSSTTIYVRLIGGLPIGSYNSENIIASSSDALDKTVTLNSAVYLQNDICSGAIDILCGSSAIVDNSFASNDVLPGISCGSTTVGIYKGLWYKITPAVSGSVTLNTCGSTSFDTYLRVYSGSCDALNSCLGFNDDASAACPSGTLYSSVTFNALSGTTYYVLSAIYSNTGSTGPITLEVSCPVEAPLANDVTVCDSDFTATWTSNENPTGISFLLDVSTSNSFSTFVSGYNGLSVSGTSQTVSVPAGTYFYRVRAVRGSIISLNSNTATAQVNSSPVITCPSNISEFTLGACGANVNFAATATGIPGSSFDYSTSAGAVFSGDFFPIGETKVNVIATNSCGTSVCDFNITVIDNEAPVAICQDITVELDIDGNGSISAEAINNGSSDACGIASLSLDISAFTCANIGNINNVILTVTDNNNNSSTCTAKVTVVDNISPAAICQDIIVELDNDGNGNTTADAINNGSSDACGIASLSLDNNSFSCANVGNGNNVVLTVTDNNNNSSTCTAIVTVVDIIAPIAVCQDVTVELDNTGNGSTTTTAIDNSSSDACGINLSLDNSAFTCANVGNGNTVVLTVTDNNNNSSTCTATVTVVDGVVPIAICQDITVQLDNTGNGSITADAINNGSSDACGIASLSLDNSSFSCANVGNGNTVVLTVTDNNNNSSTCSATITVVDAISPIAVCQDITVQLDNTGNVTITTQDINNGSSDACGISLSIDNTAFTCANIGNSNTVVLTVTDNNNNSSTCNATVTVVDGVATIAICQDVTVQLDNTGNGSTTATAVNNGSSDACGIASLSLDNSSFSCANVGNGNTVVLTVTDNNNNSSTCSAAVTVVDGIAPIPVCQDVTVQLDATGNGSTTATEVNNGSSDACGISLSLDNTAFTCANVGNGNTVVLTVTDNNNNSSACSATVTVVDGIAPMAVCQDVTVQLDNTGNGSTSAAAVDNGSSDACGISLSLDNTAFTCANVGNGNIVLLTVTDNNNNSTTCSAVVTVIDGVAPIAICQDVTIQLDNTGNGSTSAAAVNNGSSDACGISSLVLSQVNFSCSEVGANPETLTVTDANGNVSTCSTTITVADEIAPEAICKDIIIELDAGGNAIITSSSVNNGSTDACGIAGLSITQSSFNCNQIGENTVTLTVTDVNGNSSSCDAIITVEDNVAPISLCQNVTVYLNNTGYGSTTATAVNNGSTDACGLLPQCIPHGPMVSCLSGLMLDKCLFSCNDVGPNTVTLTATDNNNNTSTCTAIVTVIDDLAPIALCQDVTVQLDATGNGSTSATAVDNGSSDACGIASLVLSQTAFVCSEVGSKTVTLTVTDVNNNISVCSATITVEDNVAPVALCQNVTVQLDATGNGSTTATAVDNGSSDACGIASLVLSQTAFNCSEVGANTETLTVTDVNGNVTTCTTTVTVEDNVEPIALCQDVIVQLDATGNGSTTATAVDNGSSDACGIASIVLSQTAFNCSEVGANTETLTVTDVNGNVTTCTTTITVEDNVAPIALCQDLTLQLSASGTASTTAVAVNNGSSDACGITLALSTTSFNCSNVGANPVTLTVTDANGNVTTCNALVTIQDITSPAFTCPPSQTLVAAAGNLCAVATWSVPVATDNCSVTLASNYTSGYCFPGTVGSTNTTVVTYTAVDPSGNTTTCSFNVNVNLTCSNITWAGVVGCNYNGNDDDDDDNWGDNDDDDDDHGDDDDDDNWWWWGNLKGDTNTSSGIVKNTTSGIEERNTAGNDGTADDWGWGDDDDDDNDGGHHGGHWGSWHHWWNHNGWNHNYYDYRGYSAGRKCYQNNENHCGGVDPDLIGNIATPVGGVGTIEYQWLSSTTGVPTTLASAIPGATSATYDPPYITQTTYYVRLAKRSACGTWIASNVIRVKVYPDVKDPKINNCPRNIVSNTTDFNCKVVTWTPPTATDECTLVSLTSNYNSGYCFPVGETDVVYTATDAAGNTETCSFEVTIIAPCYPITNGGTVSMSCVSGSVEIGNLTIPSGGSGTLQYEWRKSTTSSSPNSSSMAVIAGANGPTLSVGSVAQTTYYVRYAKRLSCNNWTASNVVTVTPNACASNCSGNVLFVAGTTTLNAADNALRTRIQNLGYTVTVMDDNVTTNSSANGNVLVVISNTIVASTVGTKFRDVTVPVIVLDGELFSNMRMVSNGGSNYGVTNITTATVVNGHPIAGSLSGSTPLYTSSQAATFGRPTASAVTIAQNSSTSANKHIFAYESGSAMVSQNAPQRRVGFYVAATNSALTTQGNTLFDNAVKWATGCLAGSFAPTAPTAPAAVVQPTEPANSSARVAGEIKANAYPNPFKYTTTIAFTVTESTENAKLSIFDIEGKDIKQLYDGPAEKDLEYQFQFNAESTMESGIYFYRLQTKEGKVVVNKLIMVK